jgi:hypothetical protein
MKRFNYRQSFLERFAGLAPPAPATHGLRVPLAIAGAAAVLFAGAWGLEAQRMAQLDHDLDALNVRVRAAKPAADRASAVIAATARAQTEYARVLAARREAVTSTNTIARLGNALPPRTWLTNVQSTPAGAWTIAGRSDRVAEIGTTLRAIQQFDTRAQTRLVSISASGRTGEVLNFVIGWDRQP